MALRGQGAARVEGTGRLRAPERRRRRPPRAGRGGGRLAGGGRLGGDWLSSASISASRRGSSMMEGPSAGGGGAGAGPGCARGPELRGSDRAVPRGPAAPGRASCGRLLLDRGKVDHDLGHVGLGRRRRARVPVGTRSSPWTAMLVGRRAPRARQRGRRSHHGHGGLIGGVFHRPFRPHPGSLETRRPRPGGVTTGGIGISPVRRRGARRRVNSPTRCSSSPPPRLGARPGGGRALGGGPPAVPAPGPRRSDPLLAPAPAAGGPIPVVGRSMALRRMMPMSSRRVMVRRESNTRNGLSSRTSPRQRWPSNSRITGTTSAGIESSRRATRSASCTNRDWAWPMFLVAWEKSRRNRSQSSSSSSPPGQRLAQPDHRTELDLQGGLFPEQKLVQGRVPLQRADLGRRPRPPPRIEAPPSGCPAPPGRSRTGPGPPWCGRRSRARTPTGRRSAPAWRRRRGP